MFNYDNDLDSMEYMEGELPIKVYSEYVCDKDSRKKDSINRSLYRLMTMKYKIAGRNSNKENADIIFTLINRGYSSETYNIEKCPENLDVDRLALICAEGNLVFGYSGNKGTITIYTD